MKSIKNVQQILERKSFRDFLSAMNGFVDIKEWSEVGGVYNVCRSLLKGFDPDYIFDIGCGRRPTFGTVMALNYSKPVYCVDPQLSFEYGQNINRLFRHCKPVNEFLKVLDDDWEGEKLSSGLIVGNHAHVSKKDMMKLLAKFKEWVYITVPCCIDNKLSNQFCIHYKDIHMHTPKNEIFIYANDKKHLKGLF